MADTGPALSNSIQPTRYLYVSANAAAGGDGSQNRPFNTIQQAVGAATAGTAIMVEAGEYHENVKLPSTSPTTADAPIWLVSADGRGAAKIIAPSNDVAAIYGYGTDNFVVKDFAIEGGKNGIQFSQSSSNFTNMVQNITIVGNIIRGTAEDGIKIDQADTVRIIGNTVDTTGQEGVDFVAVNNSVVAYNDVSNASGSAGIMVKGGSTNVLIDANDVHDIPKMDGILVGGWTGDQFFVPGFTGYEAKNVTVINNEVHNVNKRPVNILGAVDSTVTGNYLQANAAYYWAMSVDDGSPTAKVIAHSQNIEITNNIIANTQRIQVSSDSSAISIHDNAASGAWTMQTGPAAIGAGDLSFIGGSMAYENVLQGNTGVAYFGGDSGNDSDNTLLGGAGADTLTGNGGNDTLNGGDGADTMVGGLGNDTYVVDQPGDVVVESPNAGNDTVIAAMDGYVLAANVENLVLASWAGAISGSGNSADNTLTGNDSDNSLVGGAGADTLTGNGGNDTLNGGDGADTMVGGLGNDTYVVDHPADVVVESPNAGNDTVMAAMDGYVLAANVENLVLASWAGAISGSGNSADNTLTGNDSDNTLWGGAGADTLTGNGGNDTLNGGDGADTMVGGLGNDTYVVDNAGDVITESPNAGTDTVIAAYDGHVLGPNLENLVLAPWAGAISGSGNSADNALTGNDSDNTLLGGAGADTLTGNGGHDTFAFSKGDGLDVVTDLSTTGSSSDTLSLSGYGVLNFTALQPFISQSGADTVIALDAQNRITLLNVQATQLTSGNFLFH